MNIGNIQFGERPLFLAPMEDVTDIGFRHLCKRFGASMVYTEFVSAEALVRSVNATLRKLTISDEERPVGIQIYGRDVESMVEAAKIVEQVKPDVIDINFGCPVKKVAGKGAGAGMLQNIPLLLDITREVVKAVNTPVTVKTRLGWNHDQLVICDLAEALQDCGIQALTNSVYTIDAPNRLQRCRNPMSVTSSIGARNSGRSPNCMFPMFILLFVISQLIIFVFSPRISPTDFTDSHR